MPLPGGFKTTRVYFSQFWRLEVPDHGVGRVGFSQGLSPWLVHGRLLLSLSLHRLHSVLKHPRCLSDPFYFRGSNLLFLEGHQAQG